MPLENYLQSAKNLTNNEDAVNLIREVIEDSQIFVFGELLELPQIQSLKESANLSKWFNLLELFAYGKVVDYNDQIMPALTDSMIKKLRLLTIVTLATNKSKKVPYSVLGKELKLTNLRELEDLIIEAIYSNLVKGKLDQKSVCLEVESTLARDVKFDRIDDISSVLINWISNCESILSNIDKQAKFANAIKSENKTKKIELENYMNTMKKTIKVTNQEMDENIIWETTYGLNQHHEYEKGKRGSFKPSKFSLKNRNNRF